MPHTVNAAWLTHIALAVTTRSLCWHITRADATEYLFTNHDAPLTIASGDYAGTYTPTGGFIGSAFEDSDSVSASNMQVEAVLESNGITEADILAGLYDYATYEVFEVDWTDPDAWQFSIAEGTLGQISYDDGTARVDIVDESAKLAQADGRKALIRCGWDLGDSNCGVSLGAFTVSGAVTSVTSRFVFEGDTLPAAAGGLLVWTSGANNGYAHQVAAISGSAMRLLLPTRYTIAITDTYDVYRGCDKTRSTCKDVFGNIPNHGGFPDMPTSDQVLDFPNAT